MKSKRVFFSTGRRHIPGGAEDKMLGGDFVIKMKDEKTIDTVYSWE